MSMPIFSGTKSDANLLINAFQLTNGTIFKTLELVKVAINKMTLSITQGHQKWRQSV